MNDHWPQEETVTIPVIKEADENEVAFPGYQTGKDF